MQITEAKIFNYGKLQNRTFHFMPGVNVVYGQNESGKSTLHAFLSSMLFGMEKGRGRAAAGDMYTRYEPWHAPSFYSGALQFEVGGRPFYLERNFYSKEKKELLRNLADGEELSVAYGDLAVLLGGIGREIFGNTYDIPQSGAVTGKELAGILAEYLANAASGGDGNLQVKRAMTALRSRKKKVAAEVKALEQEREAYLREQRMLRELLQQECVRQRQEVQRVEGELLTLKRQIAEKMQNDADMAGESADCNDNAERVRRLSDENDGENQGKKRRLGGGSYAGMILSGILLCGIFVLGMAILGIAARTGNYPGMSASQPLFWVLELLLGTGGILSAKMVLRIFKGKPKEKWQEPEEKRQEPEEQQQEPEDYASAAVTQAEQMLDHLKESLLEKETRLYNIEEQLREEGGAGSYQGRKYRERFTELIREQDALELAASEIERLSKEYYEDVEDELNAQISRIVSALTGGAYDSVRVDGDGKLKIQTNGREMPPEALSRGTLEQIYLALRIAVGNVVMAEEPMPLFLDETFAMYDDKRLAETLRYLAGMGQQIVIFTCQKREMEIIEQLGITYQRINLE